MDKIEEKNDNKKEEKSTKTISLKHFGNKIVMSLIIFLLSVLICFLCINVMNLKKELDKEKTLYISKLDFKNVGQLVTQTANVTVVKNYKDSREFLKLFNIPFTEYVLIFSYDVEVDGYVDFEKVHYTEDKENKKIYVEIPHAQNKDPVLDEDSLNKLYDNTNTVNSVDFDKSNELRKEIKNKALKAALDQGLLEKAEKNAEKVIENMLKTNTEYRDYDVEFNYIGG